MTEISAGDPGASGNGGDATSFKANGGTSQDQGAADNTVVLELGGRKFTKADLVTKITSADEHIARLTTERQEDRALLAQVNDKLGKMVGSEEVLRAIREGKQPDPVKPNQDSAKVPTVAEVAEAVKAGLKAEQTAAQQEANWASVTTTLTGVFGDKVDAKVKEVAAEVGMTHKEAVEMARTRPQAFLRLFPDLKAAKPVTPAILPGNVNSQAHLSKVKSSASGFAKAGSERERTTIYLDRLRQLGL